MSDYVMPPNQLKKAMNKQEAYKLLFNQHLAKNYPKKKAIMNVHRIINEQTPEEIEAIIEGRKVIEIKPQPRMGAGPLIPTLKDVMEDLNKAVSGPKPSQTEIPADSSRDFLPDKQLEQPAQKYPMLSIEIK